MECAIETVLQCIVVGKRTFGGNDTLAASRTHRRGLNTLAVRYPNARYLAGSGSAAIVLAVTGPEYHRRGTETSIDSREERIDDLQQTRSPDFLPEFFQTRRRRTYNILLKLTNRMPGMLLH